MEETIRDLYVQSLRAKLELSRIVSARLMRDLESPRLTDRQKQESFCRWFDATRDGDILEFVSELLRRRELRSPQIAISRGTAPHRIRPARGACARRALRESGKLKPFSFAVSRAGVPKPRRVLVLAARVGR